MTITAVTVEDSIFNAVNIHTKPTNRKYNINPSIADMMFNIKILKPTTK